MESTGLRVAGVTKRYGALVALDRVDATFSPGEVHAVLGENGAGKSTLMGVMSGFVVPNEGQVLLDGEPVPVGKAFECKRMGIEMIHQHFTLVPEFTAAENLALARLPGLSKSARVGSLADPALQIAERLGWQVDPNERVRTMPVGVQQRLEILKALSGNARVLVFDEPTAVLAPDEVDDLFRVLRRLRDDGKVVVLIAHKLSEVMAVADRVTVLRRGKVVATAVIGDTSPSQLASWMVGEMPIPGAKPEAVEVREGLRADGLVVAGDRGETAVRGVNLRVGRGEIVGIGGVDGNGQVELAEALVGVRRSRGPSVVQFEERPVQEAKVAYIPQDRQVAGLAVGMSVEDNLLVTGHRKPELSSGPLMVVGRVHAWARSLIDRFGIKVSGPAEAVSSLSGGNQQKVVVSRALDTQPDLLVAVNPTRGLDIKATEYVHEKIREARAAGAAVALFTTDLDELYALSDRTLFMSRGELVEDQGAVSLVGGPG
jgi:simple sugar transport system ATP-binding protein